VSTHDVEVLDLRYKDLATIDDGLITCADFSLYLAQSIAPSVRQLLDISIEY